MIGTIVGSYQITSVLSAGGMGTVYGATHSLIGRPAAVKILHPEYSTNREIVNRFFNEARATSSIAHPGIVEIFDFGYLPDGLAYLVMEFLDGEPLSYRIRRGRMEEPRLAFLLRSACGALAAAHAKGIVHRDLKPDNIYIVRDPDNPYGERTKLLDFGIAKLTDIGLAGTATKTGAVMGTPTYMSPEQCRGTGDVDARADIYSMGCVLYELVTGRPPFTQQGAGELIGAHLYATPASPRTIAPVSEGLEALIMSCLAKDPSARPQTANELGSELARLTGILSSPNLIGAGIAPTPAPYVYANHNTPTTFTPSGQAPANPATGPGPASRPGQRGPASQPGAQATAGVTSTTLGGTASQITAPAAASRSPLPWVAVGVMVAIAAGVGIFFVTQKPSAKPAETPAAVAPPPPPAVVDAAMPDAPSDAALPPDAAPPDAAPPDAAPAAVPHKVPPKPPVKDPKKDPKKDPPKDPKKDPPKDPKAGNGSGQLIETDID
ncbi:MAG TPA: protein kinase [Kofleriaceae bacterium]|nr:protein kinase [Kofleriaceae bacterium]